VVLSDFSKAKDAPAPRPQHLSGYRKHIDVRARLARANDQGVGEYIVLFLHTPADIAYQMFSMFSSLSTDLPSCVAAIAAST